MGPQVGRGDGAGESIRTGGRRTRTRLSLPLTDRPPGSRDEQSREPERKAKSSHVSTSWDGPGSGKLNEGRQLLVYGLTVMLTCRVACCPPLSATCRVNVKVPGVVGVPVIRPGEVVGPAPAGADRRRATSGS
jgi:hypothetical protein